MFYLFAFLVSFCGCVPFLCGVESDVEYKQPIDQLISPYKTSNIQYTVQLKAVYCHNCHYSIRKEQLFCQNEPCKNKNSISVCAGNSKIKSVYIIIQDLTTEKQSSTHRNDPEWQTLLNQTASSLPQKSSSCWRYCLVGSTSALVGVGLTFGSMCLAEYFFPGSVSGLLSSISGSQDSETFPSQDICTDHTNDMNTLFGFLKTIKDTCRVEDTLFNKAWSAVYGTLSEAGQSLAENHGFAPENSLNMTRMISVDGSVETTYG